MKDILEKTQWDAALKELGTEGLPRKKARDVLPGAVAFLCGAEQKERKQYLTEGEVKLQKETTTQLQELRRQYPKIEGYIDFLFVEERARLLRGEIRAEGEMETVRILNFIGLAQKIEAVNEWIPLGEGKWRRATETEGSTYLPQEAKNAGIHPFDFRKGQMKSRHYIPPRNAGPNTIALVTLLRERYAKADAEYKAARSKVQKPATVTAGVTPEVTPEAAPVALKQTRKATQRRTKGHEEGEKTGRPQARAKGKTRRQQADEDVTEAES